MSRSMSSGWIGCDLDGTIAEYAGYINHTHIGKPIKRMVDRIKYHLSEGAEVRIFTARVYYPEGNEQRKQEAQESREAITKWCEEHVGQPLKVTCTKDYSMWLFYDDRCVQIEPNTGRLSTQVAEFKGYEEGKHDAEVMFKANQSGIQAG